MKKIKSIIGICILIASFFFFQYLFSNWDAFKVGFREGNCIERSENLITMPLIYTAFLLSLCWSIAYVWYYWGRLAFYKGKKRERADELLHGVSVVVAAGNKEPQLDKLVRNLMSQVYPDFEVIVVNDRSTDGSQALLETLQRQFSKLKIVQIDQLPAGWTGKKYALHRGICQAEKEIVLLTDADCLPVSPHWIMKISQNFNPDTDFVLGFSPYRSQPGLLNQFIRYEALLRGVQYLSTALSGNPYMGVGRNLAYRKSLFVEKGFGGDEAYVGGDDDVLVNKHAHRKNTVVEISAESQTCSESKKTGRAYFTQKIRHLSAGKRYRIKDQIRLGLFALSNGLGWLLFIYLLWCEPCTEWVLILFACRSFSFYTIFTCAGQKLNVKFAYWVLPLPDLCYTIGYPVVGLIAIKAKKIKWS